MSSGRGLRGAQRIAKSLLELLLQADDIPTRNDAEEMAKRILKLREQGRANEVTEEMMEQADPYTMAAYTPLDMSTEARMERAGLLGFNPDEKAYHGAHSDPERHSFDEFGRPVYTTDNPAVANTYTYDEDSTMYDLLVQQDGGLDVDVDGTIFNAISPKYRDRQSGETIADYFTIIEPQHRNREHYFEGKIEQGPVVSTDTIADAAFADEQTNVRLRNIKDRGIFSPRAWPLGGFNETRNDDAFKTSKAIRQWERDMQDASRKPSTVQITYDDGGKLRSRFARFDPEFSHLKNLSAATVPASVGLAQMLQGGDVSKQDIEEYLRKVGGL